MFEQRSLSTLLERQIGGGTPPRSNPAFWNGPIPWASVKDFEDASLTLSSTAERISQSGLDASTANLIPAGTPLVCTRMAVGRCAITTQPVAINQDVRALTPKAEVQPRYLLRLLDFLRPAAESQAVGSTVKGIRTSDYLAIKVPVAPAIEQPVIARILDTLDTQIEKTQALIAKLEQVKEGLLHDLLTRGVDENGELRPSVEEAPELYKASPLGLIPRAWKAERLASVLARIEAGWSPDCQDVPPPLGHWGVLKVSAVSGGIFKPSESKVLTPGLPPFPSLEVKAGDVLCVRANGVADLVAQTVFVESTPPKLMLSDKTLRLVPEANYSARFLSMVMRSIATRTQVGRLLNGSSGQRNISQGQIKSILVPRPPANEQVVIDGRMHSIQKTRAALQRQLASVHSLKVGLMDDLLTGRVRVTPLLEREAAEVS